MDTTIKATITQDDINKAEAEYVQLTEAQLSLERLIGTYETYGTFSIVRPGYSALANPNVTFKKGA